MTAFYLFLSFCGKMTPPTHTYTQTFALDIACPKMLINTAKLVRLPEQLKSILSCDTFFFLLSCSYF